MKQTDYFLVTNWDQRVKIRKLTGDGDFLLNCKEGEYEGSLGIVGYLFPNDISSLCNLYFDTEENKTKFTMKYLQ